MRRMKNPSQICEMQSSIPMEGYLYCQEKCECSGCLDVFLDCNAPSDRLFPCQQGLWVCRGSNITADIIRRGGSCSWHHVSRRTQLSRCHHCSIFKFLSHQFLFLSLLVLMSQLLFFYPRAPCISRSSPACAGSRTP